MLKSLNGSVPALQADSHGIQINSAPVPPYIFNRCKPGCVAHATKNKCFHRPSFWYLDLGPKVPGWPRPPITFYPVFIVLFLTFQLRSHLTEVLLDQIPSLGELQRYLSNLSMMEPPAAKTGIVLEQVSQNEQQKIWVEACFKVGLNSALSSSFM